MVFGLGKGLKDFSLNLPSWAFHKGYRLYGEGSTFGDLYLVKGVKVIRKWGYREIPSILELDEELRRIDDSQG